MLKALQIRSARCRKIRASVLTCQVLAVLLILMGVLDVISTNAFLNVGHIEANPIIAAIQDQFGSFWFIPKLAVHVALAAFVLWLPSRRMIWNARAGIAAYLVIVFSNFQLSTITI